MIPAVKQLHIREMPAVTLLMWLRLYPSSHWVVHLFPANTFILIIQQGPAGLSLSLASPKETFLTFTRPKVPHLLCEPDDDDFLLTLEVCEKP